MEEVPRFDKMAKAIPRPSLNAPFGLQYHLVLLEAHREMIVKCSRASVDTIGQNSPDHQHQREP